jgi:hypothetical protein
MSKSYRASKTVSRLREVKVYKRFRMGMFPVYGSELEI